MKQVWATMLLCGMLAGAAAPVAAALEEGRAGAAVYLSGGVGNDEQAEIRGRLHEFNVRLLFAERGGAYLASVEVRLLDAKGRTVLALPATGPYLLLRLAPGRYRLQAAVDGKVRQGALNVPAKGRRDVTLRW